MREIPAQSAKAQTDWITRIDTRRLQIDCWIALIAIAIVRAWFTRYSLSTVQGDSLAYLDIARKLAEGHPGAIVHAYWSPAYPTLLSLFLRVFRPGAYWESPLVHFANVLIFVGALASFQLFWREVRLWHEDYVGDSCAAIPEAAFWALGYAMFAIATLSVITVALVNPDMLVVAFCCLAGWAALRFRRAPSVARALLLGIVLALGYYAKAPFFAIGLIFLLCACFGWPALRPRMILLGGTALAGFLLLCAPFIAAISVPRGRLTFGDSARLNQAFFVDGVSYYVHWQGGPAGSGMPVHPTRKLNDYPEIYAFAKKDMGTYPPWFDPTYWYEGVIPHFNWKVQPKLFVANVALFELQTIVESGAHLVCAAILLALLANYRRVWVRGLWELWFVWLPGAVALLMFAPVHVEPRFLGGWLVLLFAGAISACSLSGDESTKRVVKSTGLAVLVTTGAALALQASQEAIGLDHASGRSPRSASIAVFLLRNGLHYGDPVSVIGAGDFAYWAHLARLQVVAEIPANIRRHPTHPSIDFWQSGEEQQAKALAILEKTGAKAVIADPQGSATTPMASIIPAPWKRIDGTDAYVYFFHANP
jgi:hypothetical protein